MRRPVAVRRVVADRGEGLALLDARSFLESVERIECQVTVEREERAAVLGVVLEEDRGAIVERLVVETKAMHPAFDRRVDGRFGRREEIQTDVDRPGLGARAERCRRVEGPRLVVASDAPL